ncbi:MAG: hypothetical protein QM791_14600 [Ferruginibacter sp.]
MDKCLLSLLVILLCSNNLSANIFRVNNALSTDPTQKIYNTILEANNAATVAAGDTLMIEGSTTNYGNTTLSKRLVLFGPGYFLTANPQTQASPLQAVLYNLTLGSAASGTVIAGLSFHPASGSYTPYINNASNIVIMRCYLPSPVVIIGTVSNVQIIQNYFVGTALDINSTAYTFNNISLKNNYIGAALSIASADTYQRIFSSVENNIFNGNVALTATIFRSNIIVPTTATVTISSGSIENNLVSNGQLPTSNGNQTYVAANLFAGAAGNSTDGQYKLKAGSPYLAAGYNGIQPGIFGGTTAYVLSGQPPVPAIYQFTADGFVNKQDGLPINIKVKANQ